MFRSRKILGWIAYDWATQPFATLITTWVYAAFFTNVIAADAVTGTALWSRGITISALVVAGLAPFAGALADARGWRKRLWLGMTVITIGFTAALYFPVPGDVLLALSFFIIANIAFELAQVFYNAYLPELVRADQVKAARNRIGRLSGAAYAAGYVGGVVALGLALWVFILPDTAPFGLDAASGEPVRATNLFAAAWIALFSIPVFWWIAEVPAKGRPSGGVVRGAVRELRATFGELRRYRQVLRLLIARLFYNDGLITVFFFGGIYAAGTFGFSTAELMVFGVVLNLVAGAGAWLFGLVDDRIGGRNTILISLGLLMAATALGALAPDKTTMWIAGILIGLAAGPNQAASRSLLGRFVPPAKEAEFFGFFAFSGKATAFAGPALLGILTQVFDSQRAGIAAVLPFFIIGALILWTVDEREGEQAAAVPVRPG